MLYPVYEKYIVKLKQHNRFVQNLHQVNIEKPHDES